MQQLGIMFVLICKYASGTHSCVSFQGFAESYNNTFDLPPEYDIFIRDSLSKVLICIIELSPNIVADIFYNGEIE